MRSLLILSLPLLAATAVAAAEPELLIDRTLTHSCKRPSKNGDTINAHYRGTLKDSGKEFDASYNRGQPLSFGLGKGQVIKGWDLGLLDMCPGDKRTLTIPPELGYGNRAMGPIPAGSTLVFETELVSIVGVEAEEKVVVPKPEAKEEKVETGKGAAEEKEKEKAGTETEAEAPVQEENPQDEAAKEQKAREEL